MIKKIYIITIITFIIDQIVKLIVPRGINLTIIKDFFSLTYVENFGGAWGIFSGNLIFLIIVSSIAFVILNRFILSEEKISLLGGLSYGLLMGGILGNLCDRIVRGYVIDFLNFYILGYDFPVFNIADILVVLGMFLMFIDILRGEEDGIKSRKG